MPYLLPLPEEIWSPSDDTIFTAARYLVLQMAPSRLHTTFSSLTSKVIQKYPNVSIAKKALVIHDDRYSCRVDCGPCLVNRSISEVRVVVRSDSLETCGKVADTIVESQSEFLREFCEGSIKVSCCNCLHQYIDLSDVQSAESQGKTEIKCQGCRKNVAVNNLLKGCKGARVPPDLTYSGPASPGIRLL